MVEFLIFCGILGFAIVMTRLTYVSPNVNPNAPDAHPSERPASPSSFHIGGPG